MNLNIDPIRKISLSEAIAHQHQAKGIEPLPLEQVLLLKRIAAGGHSGQFLADAFVSAYRKTPFKHSLGELTKLDAEAFRLFHGIIHMRHISDWSDDLLYGVEQLIAELTGRYS